MARRDALEMDWLFFSQSLGSSKRGNNSKVVGIFLFCKTLSYAQTPSDTMQCRRGSNVFKLQKLHDIGC